MTATDHLVTAETTVAKLTKLWLQYLCDEGRIERTTVNEAREARAPTWQSNTGASLRGVAR